MGERRVSKGIIKKTFHHFNGGQDSCLSEDEFTRCPPTRQHKNVINPENLSDATVASFHGTFHVDTNGRQTIKNVKKHHLLSTQFLFLWRPRELSMFCLYSGKYCLEVRLGKDRLG